MDAVKIGGLICRLRKEQGMTQAQLAEAIHVSSKAVSKWETGQGCPDISLLERLGQVFSVDMESLLAGSLDPNTLLGGNMKKMRFYICPTCGNIITALGDASVSCCGKKLSPLQAQPAAPDQRLQVEDVENELFITSDHPMTKQHYIAFVALLNDDSILLRKQYPEWGLQLRMPALPHSTLYWYCTEHGLFCQRL